MRARACSKVSTRIMSPSPARRGCLSGCVIFRHALRNVLIPLVTVSRSICRRLLAARSSSSRFSPGREWAHWRSAPSSDATIPYHGITLLGAVTVVVSNLLADLDLCADRSAHQIFMMSRRRRDDGTVTLRPRPIRDKPLHEQLARPPRHARRDQCLAPASFATGWRSSARRCCLSLALVSFAAPLIVRHDPYATDLRAYRKPPSRSICSAPIPPGATCSAASSTRGGSRFLSVWWRCRSMSQSVSCWGDWLGSMEAGSIR